jgi:hypothetical protein
VPRRVTHPCAPNVPGHHSYVSDVLTLDPVGAFWDTEVDMLKWGTFVNATGRKGWNSVTVTVACRRS